MLTRQQKPDAATYTASLPRWLVYLLFLFIAQWTFHHLHPTGLVVYLLAVLPALPLIGSLAIVGLYIAEESDEFERSILVQSMLWGLGGALSVSTIWGSLEDFANAPHLSYFLRLPLLLDLHGNLPAIHPHEVPMKNRLRILRAERNWSQADLAQNASKSPASPSTPSRPASSTPVSRSPSNSLASSTAPSKPSSPMKSKRPQTVYRSRLRHDNCHVTSMTQATGSNTTHPAH